MAGTTVTWKTYLTYYPPDDWTLTYTFVRQGASSDRQQVECTDNGDGYHLATISSTTSADFAPTSGPSVTYRWYATVTDGTTIVNVGDGHVEVTPDLLAAAVGTDGYDMRTHAEKMCDAYESVMTGRATKKEAATATGDDSVQFKTDAEIRKEYFAFLRIAQRERREQRLGKQIGVGGNLVIRRG
jgi:hypothetical protein